MPSSPAPAYPLALLLYALLYGGMVCMAGVLGVKQVALGPLAVEAGIFAFLLLVAMGSAVAELYGKATADRLVRIGFVPLIVVGHPDPLVLIAADRCGHVPARRRRLPDRRRPRCADDGRGADFLRHLADAQRADLRAALTGARAGWCGCAG